MFTPCLTAISNAIFSPPSFTVGAADTMATMAKMLNRMKVFILSVLSIQDMNRSTMILCCSIHACMQDVFIGFSDHKPPECQFTPVQTKIETRLNVTGS